ncbi:TetR/AcrR family transcriptional regulator [Streptococcus sp. X16XC17]|uniref:TetR/AcrR family transcriptional regulator n=1 Tax=unclassified Streptococcus TaxID=2608887 RepID=UPI00066FCEC7|nr:MULTISPECIES: TetR/AcrR family transcriptional regulator [unclassified Streptococcus]TCD46087.1 TetR/AcrR family transcriptional regulator [Streptococcus sp. X16XC17]
MAQQRHTETKLYIKEAVTQLLSEKAFEQLTISHITHRAGINRGTFYLHYQDKYDMMAQFKEDTLDQIFYILQEEENHPRQAILRTLIYIQENFAFISAMSKTRYINFSESIKEFILRILAYSDNFETAVTSVYHIPFLYAREVYLASLESIISLWIENGAKESPQEMADILLRIGYIEDNNLQILDEKETL